MTFREEFDSASITWAPWPGVTAHQAGLGRPFLIVPTNVVRARLSPPPTPLPLIWRSQDMVCFELPLPAWQTTEQDVQVRLIRQDGTEAIATLVLSGGIPRPKAVAPNADEVSGYTSSAQRAAFRSASILSQHAESVNELTFPRKDAPVRQVRAEGLTVTSWEDFDETFWAHNDEDGPMRLIVRIAIDCTSLLDSICERPRRILRRERLPERLDRVQQMDDSCIRWFVRQPGRTILEKAGPRQRVLSVVRLETADTPENRIVRDFLERCLRAGEAYLRENVRRPQSYRVKLVRRFRNRLRHWTRRSDIAQVPLPVGIPQPNYVLQFDERYSRIWYWYERLRRQQLYEDEMWRWQHRTWAEHVTLAVLHALSGLPRQRGRFREYIYLRSDPLAGRFVDERSPVGLWVIDADGPLLIESFIPSQVAKIDALPKAAKSVIGLGPDLVVIARRPFSNDANARVLALWSSIGIIDINEDILFRRWLSNVITCANNGVPWHVVTPALVLPMFSDSTNRILVPTRLTAIEREVHAAAFALPFPIDVHLPWLTDQIADWARGGAL